MALAQKAKRRAPAPSPRYVLDEQVGFILRQVNQRHTTIFAAEIGNELTPTQWAVLAKLQEMGPTSQNLLGRMTAMDAATVKGVVDRLTRRGFTETGPDPADTRRLVVALTEAGREAVRQSQPNALRISEETLSPLTAEERETLLALLKKLR